ncbi:MAG: acyltransferase [Propionicimonas sp.]
MANEGESRRAHWPGLDGLRGIAALAVVMFHASIANWAVNGYAGVDLFFCLSGFLITSLLLVEVTQTGRVHLVGFYGRRLLRLYPALVAAVVGVLLLALVAGSLDAVAAPAAASLLYASNWWLFTGHDMPLLEHTWTLAIEEHFYMVWPALILLLASRRWRLVGVGLGAALLALLMAPWPQEIAAVKYTYSRGAAIIWGSTLAFVVHRRWVGRAETFIRWLAVPAVLGVVGVLVVPYRLPEGLLTGPGGLLGWAAMVVVAAVVLAPTSLGVGWLAWEPLRWAGRRSYGIYLYHFPILSLLRHQVPVGPLPGRMVIGVLATMILAELSYRWWELPFLRLKGRLRVPPDSRVEQGTPGWQPS